jgi:hypothetical protein
MILRTHRFLAGFLALAGLWGLSCSEPDQPATITLTPASFTLDALGQTQTLTSTVSDAKGKLLTGVALTWASSGAAVSVDQSGVVAAVANGTAEVTASAGAVTGKANVTVGQAITKVDAVSGAQQTGPVGQALPQQVAVRLRDRLDQPVSGAAVAFTVDADGGTVAPASGTTGPDGQLAATWTLGTKKGAFHVSASAVGTALGATFAATATPGPANNLAAVSGNNQYGYHDERLAQFIAVRVRDQYGNGIPSYSVQFATDPGNGTADSAIAFSDSGGVARTGWIMPGTAGTVTLQARALSAAGAPLLGSPVSYTAVSHNIKLMSISPTTLIEGQSATLTGTGFDAGNTQNVVSIDGVSAAVTAASATQLTVTVPAYDCQPARNVAVQVAVGGTTAAPVSAPLSPTSTLSLAAGQQQIVSDPTQFCFQFPAASAQETYLIGVQSTSEAVSSLTPITLVGTAGGASAAPPAPAAAFAPQSATLPPQLLERLQRWRRHQAAELRRREFDRVNYETLRAAAFRAPQAAVVPFPPVDSTVAVGDTVKQIRVATSGSCSNYAEITTVVRAKGADGIFLEDVGNPTGFTASDFAGFSQTFDAKIFPTLVTEFGAPTDADHNGRVVIVVTKELNKLSGGELGFVTSCDLFSRGVSPASNGGEFTYLIAPDPNGTVNSQFRYSVIAASRDLPDLIAHEPVHMIQFTRRLAAGGDMVSVWLAEGQAVLGEEVVGDTIEGHTTGQNGLGWKEASNLDDTTSTDFYGLAFSALGLYFGWDPISQPGIHKHVNTAPWECSWLGQDYGGPCVGGVEPYGAPWALLRYISDRFGNGNPGEANLQKAIIDNTLNGYALIQAVTGVPIDSLLAQFAAMLFVDDSVPAAAAPLKLASWNLHDVFYGSFAGYRIRQELRLTPVPLTFTTFSKSANVRAASAYYAGVSGGNRPATAIKARDASGGVLPPHMRYWVVRLQ